MAPIQDTFSRAWRMHSTSNFEWQEKNTKMTSKQKRKLEEGGKQMLCVKVYQMSNASSSPHAGDRGDWMAHCRSFNIHALQTLTQKPCDTLIGDAGTGLAEDNRHSGWQSQLL